MIAPRGVTTPAPVVQTKSACVTADRGCARASPSRRTDQHSPQPKCFAELVHFWPRAFADDVAVPIRSWRLLRRSQTASPPTPATSSHWQRSGSRCQAPGVRWSLRFEVSPRWRQWSARGADIDHRAVPRANRLIARRTLWSSRWSRESPRERCTYRSTTHRHGRRVARCGVIRPLMAEDLEMRYVPPDALPSGALSSVGRCDRARPQRHRCGRDNRLSPTLSQRRRRDLPHRDSLFGG